MADQDQGLLYLRRAAWLLTGGVAVVIVAWAVLVALEAAGVPEIAPRPETGVAIGTMVLALPAGFQAVVTATATREQIQARRIADRANEETQVRLHERSMLEQRLRDQWGPSWVEKLGAHLAANVEQQAAILRPFQTNVHDLCNHFPALRNYLNLD